jgi:hypothetical protein
MVVDAALLQESVGKGKKPSFVQIPPAAAAMVGELAGHIRCSYCFS